MSELRAKHRVAVLSSHPIQYAAPLYAFLSRDPAIELTVLYCSDFSLRGGKDPGFQQAVTWDVDLLDGYSYVFLGKRAKTRSPAGFFSLICPEVWREIRRGGFDAIIIHGQQFAVNLVAFAAAKANGVRVLMRTETHLGLHRSALRRRVRDFVLQILYRSVDCCLAIGSANRNYYRSLGVPEHRIFDVPYAVDNSRFMATGALSDEERNSIREHYGLHRDQPVVLYASKFARRKHPDDVIEAVARLRQEGVKASLLLVGAGEMEDELRRRVSALGLDDVVFAGFVNQVELPRVFAASSVFVLPSENEPWGLVVNEAMCAGLPIVASAEVGCVADLIKDGINGVLSRAGDVESLTLALRRVLEDEEHRRAMGNASLEIIRGWSYEQCLQGMRMALDSLGMRMTDSGPRCASS